MIFMLFLVLSILCDFSFFFSTFYNKLFWAVLYVFECSFEHGVRKNIFEKNGNRKRSTRKFDIKHQKLIKITCFKQWEHQKTIAVGREYFIFWNAYWCKKRCIDDVFIIKNWCIYHQNWPLNSRSVNNSRAAFFFDFWERSFTFFFKSCWKPS